MNEASKDEADGAELISIRESNKSGKDLDAPKDKPINSGKEKKPPLPGKP
jgi:hypothetical protein